jgi:hypothetical protein
VLAIVALLEIRYLMVPDAYLKEDTPAVGATGTAGSETGEVGNGDGTPGGELRAPLQAVTNPERRYQHVLRSGIFMYSRLMFSRETNNLQRLSHWRLSD